MNATQSSSKIHATLALVIAGLMWVAATGCASGTYRPDASFASVTPTPVVRAQYQNPYNPQSPTPGSNQHLRYPLAPSGAAPSGVAPAGGQTPPPPGSQPPPGPNPNSTPTVGSGIPTNADGFPAWQTVPGGAPLLNSPYLGGAPGMLAPDAVGTPADVNIYLEEARTGRFMFGVGVNSDAGVTGQIIIDERNFDLWKFPHSFDDIVNGTAFRGAGQGFRVEAIPGNRVQRYLVSFTEPYLFETPVSFNASGFLYDRRFTDWDEQRLGGRLGLGYRLTHDLSVATTLRGERVDIRNPSVLGVPQLTSVLGRSDLWSGRVTLRHDTRDVPFIPTEGHLIEMSYEQVFGDFDYPRFEVEYRKYFLIRERADGSGRHTLALTLGAGFSGAQTPIFENYFAGGFTTLRGFEFRGASPVAGSVIVGGPFRTLGSLEYMMPLTADDMIKGVAFCDFGTVEEQIEINGDEFRVAPGIGLRIAIPALGPAPLALDLAFPIAREGTDRIQNFSFFFGFGRS